MRTKLTSFLFGAMLLGGCSDQNASQNEAPRQSKDGKLDYVLAFSWQPAFCERASRKRECKSQTNDRYDATNFTLHGLWPQPGSNIYCDVSEAQVEIDKKSRWNKLDVPRLPNDLWDKLKRIMPGTMSSLHKHEWVKHGTCYDTSIDEYYSDSIWLMEQLNASKLQTLFANNIGNELTGKQIRAAFDESFGDGAGERLRISCKIDQNSKRQLITELTLGLSGDVSPNGSISALIANSVKTNPGCPAGIVDPVGLQ